MDQDDEGLELIVTTTPTKVYLSPSVDRYNVSIIWKLGCILSFFLLVTESLLLYYSFPMLNGGSLSQGCSTKECTALSSSLLYGIDSNVNPCENFYQYACGNWKISHPVPEDELSSSVIELMRKTNTEMLRGELDKTDKNRNLGKLFDFYDSCVSPEIETLGIKPLLEFVSKSFADLPKLVSDVDNIDTDTFLVRFFTLVGKFHKFSLGTGILNIEVFEDMKDASSYSLYLGQGSLLLPQLYFDHSPANERSVEALRKKILQEFQVYFGVETENLTSRVEGLIGLQYKMNQILRPKEELQDPSKTYNPIPVKDLVSKFPNLKIDKFLAEVLGEELWVQSLENNPPVIVESPQFLSDLNEKITSFCSTALVDQLVAFLLDASIRHLSADLVQILVDFEKVYSGVTRMPSRQELCVGRSNYYLPFLLGRLFVDKLFSSDARERMLEIVDNINQAFIHLLQHLSWMDKETKDRAYSKAQMMKSKIAFPDFILDDSLLNGFYESLSLDNAYFMNIMRCKEFQASRMIEKLQIGTVDKQEWLMSPASVNAYYSPLMNEIVFPSGILQLPLFHDKLPIPYMYAGIGTIMGHEYIHAFDNSGSQFDGSGELHEWWSKQSRSRFTEMTQCIKDQYAEFKTPAGDALNAELTMGENIADIGGLKLAFLAAIRDDAYAKTQLSGVHLSIDQSFFLTFAHHWCTNMKPEALHQQMLSDVHPPPEFRVNGALRNTQAFADAFQCPVGSPMNPAKKCVIW